MILLHVAMSLDGFISGPDNDMSWTGGAEFDTSSGPLAAEVARTTGAIVAGRGWYDAAIADGDAAIAGIYGGAWSGPVIVLTHRPDDLAGAPGIETTSDIHHALLRAQQLAGGTHVGVFGGDVARQVLALERLDELIVQIVPVLLGDGVPLFGTAPGRPRVTLERVGFGTSGTLTDLRFRVLKST